MTGLSPSAHAASSEDNPEDGWWEPMIGPGKPIDTRSNFVICVNSLGSCKGSTGPASINPETGKQYRLSFPDLTIQDIAAAGKLVLDALGIEQLRCLIGPSMGGMSGLALMRQQPDIARHFLAISTAARAEPFAIAIRSLQREMIVRDPHWQDGALHRRRLAGDRHAPGAQAGHDFLPLRDRVAEALWPPDPEALQRALVRHALRDRVLPGKRRAQVHPQFRSLQLPLPFPGHGSVRLRRGLPGPAQRHSNRCNCSRPRSSAWIPMFCGRPINSGKFAGASPLTASTAILSMLPSVQGHDAFLVDYDRFCPAVATISSEDRVGPNSFGKRFANEAQADEGTRFANDVRSYGAPSMAAAAFRAVRMQPLRNVPSSERLPEAPPPPKPAASPTA